MTTMLEIAVAKVRKLPKRLQNKAARRLLEYVEQGSSSGVSLDEAREAFINGDFVTLAKWKRDLGLK